MRKFFPLFLILGYALAARSQSYGLYQTCTFTNAVGQAINGAQVYFLTQPANTVTLTPLASVFSTNSGGAVTQPLRTDGYGSCIAYLSPGVYTVCFISPYTGKRCFADQAISLGGGTGTVTGQASGKIPLATGVTSIGSQSHLDDGVTLAGTITSSEPIAAPAASASVNSVINVGAAPYNAKGDGGVTSGATNGTAISAACTAAKAYTPPAQVYFPKGTSYYLTTTLNACAGVSLEGPPAKATSTGNGGVTLRGMPSSDILHWGDPNTTSGAAPAQVWDISNITLQVDDTVDASASYPHRWPGRWTQDGTISLGTPTTITSTKQTWYCSDVGSAILVKGAGVAGADLVTTIASLPSCNGSQSTATLTDAASTAVANALTYTSIPGVSATQTIGNCAIAGDNFDGNTANWVMTGSVNPNYPTLHNVAINTVTGTAQHNSCGIYWQGIWQPYGFAVRDTNIMRVAYAVVLGTVDTNPANGQSGSDQQVWSHMFYGSVIYPWISYNGSEFHLEDWQLASNNGPFIMEVGTHVETTANFWTINIPEFELGSGVGWIVRGTAHNLAGSQITVNNVKTYIEGRSATCTPCVARDSNTAGLVTLNGYGNTLNFRSSNTFLATAGVVVDNGSNNTVTFTAFANPFRSQQPTRTIAANVTRSLGFVGSRAADFMIGNAATSYYNRQDLLFFPLDYEFGNAANKVPPIADSTSLSGSYAPIKATDTLAGFATFTGGVALVGTNIPASVITAYDTAKCPVQVSYTFQVRQVDAPASVIASAVFPCAATYTTNSLVVDLSSYTGHQVAWGWSGVTNEVDSSWSGIAPYAVSLTPGKNTVPKTSATVTTLAPAWLPLPAAGTIGGVQSIDCTGLGHVQKINTDGTETCAADSGSGTSCGTSWSSGGSAGSKTAAQGVLAGANQTTIWSFEPFCTMSFTKITYQPSTADNSANTYDIGIYNANGSTLICHTGATAGTTFSPSTSVVTLSIGTCSLTAGTRYIFAYTGVATTAVLNGSGLNLIAISRANVVAATTGGALNSSITVPADNWASTNGFPMISLHN